MSMCHSLQAQAVSFSVPLTIDTSHAGVIMSFITGTRHVTVSMPFITGHKAYRCQCATHYSTRHASVSVPFITDTRHASASVPLITDTRHTGVSMALITGTRHASVSMSVCHSWQARYADVSVPLRTSFEHKAKVSLVSCVYSNVSDLCKEEALDDRP